MPQTIYARRGRALAPGQSSQLTILDIASGKMEMILTADEVIEAPNWMPDGIDLLFNAGGHLYRVPADGSSPPSRLESGPVEDFNNDHVISPDGLWIYASSDDGHIYRLPIEGGLPQRISNRHERPFHYYLHGISPDGRMLSYVAVEEGDQGLRINIYLIPAVGGRDVQLTDDDFPDDGPEFSPDGRWLHFNSERAASRPGHAQLFRMRLEDLSVEQLTFDDRVNWFPHPSPDGRQLVYLSYPPETLGHPADRDVILRLMDPAGGQPRDLASFNGGQGTINVNSWSPDSRRIAFVTYPLGN